MEDLTTRLAKDFPTQKALDDYLKDHPKANKSKHQVIEKGESKAPKSDGGKDDHFKNQWEKALSDRLGRPATEADFDILKGQMKQFVQKEKSKADPAFEKKPPESPKPDAKDPFVQQWSKALSTQLGRPATQDDIDILKGKMRQFVQKAKEASIESRVAFRFIGSSIIPKYSRVFPNQKSLDDYLRAHPSADKSKHRVEDADVQRIKKDLEPFQKLKKVQEQEDRRQDRKDQKKVVKDLTKHQKAHPPGSIDWKYNPKDNKGE